MEFEFRVTDETQRHLADLAQDVSALNEPRQALRVCLTTTFDCTPEGSGQPGAVVRGEILSGPLDGLPLCYDEDSLPDLGTTPPS